MTVSILSCGKQTSSAQQQQQQPGEEGDDENTCVDADHDGFCKSVEDSYGTSDDDATEYPDLGGMEDCDDDGYSDVIEELYGSLPCDPTSTPTVQPSVGIDDTDQDGCYSDQLETILGYDMTDITSKPPETIPCDMKDCDGDGFSDYVEYIFGTESCDAEETPEIKANLVDSDGDCYSDWFEQIFGTEIDDADSFPRIDNAAMPHDMCLDEETGETTADGVYEPMPFCDLYPDLDEDLCDLPRENWEDIKACIAAPMTGFSDSHTLKELRGASFVSHSDILDLNGDGTYEFDASLGVTSGDYIIKDGLLLLKPDNYAEDGCVEVYTFFESKACHKKGGSGAIYSKNSMDNGEAGYINKLTLVGVIVESQTLVQDDYTRKKEDCTNWSMGWLSMMIIAVAAILLTYGAGAGWLGAAVKGAIDVAGTTAQIAVNIAVGAAIGAGIGAMIAGATGGDLWEGTYVGATVGGLSAAMAEVMAAINAAPTTVPGTSPAAPRPPPKTSALIAY